MKKIFLTFLLSLCCLNLLFAQRQYNTNKGENIIYEEDVLEEVFIPAKTTETGIQIPAKKVKVRKKVASDKYGNANGNKYDLAVDGAFEGNTIAVLHLYQFNFNVPKAALKEKGFSVYRWIGNPPSPQELKKALDKSCQLWIISDKSQKLNNEHLEVIKKFFESGKGVYIWGDNEPYYADANFVAEGLLGVQMTGNLTGDQVVGLQSDEKKVGLLPKHLITTGLAYVYEGITIATIQEPDASKLAVSPTGDKTVNKSAFKPLIYGSAGNLVTVAYEENGKRAIIDGGFTRLYNKWDTAGTGRYVKNAAAWLVNIERFEAKK